MSKRKLQYSPQPSSQKKIGLNPNIITEEQRAIIKKELDETGITVFGPVKDSQFVKETIDEIKTHLEGQPRVPEYKINLSKTTNLSTAEVAKWKQCWVTYVTFGAPVEPPAYHLKRAWALRQDAPLSQLFAYLLNQPGTEKLREQYYKEYLPLHLSNLFVYPILTRKSLPKNLRQFMKER
eukprot:TRINITY_DN9609_c0_g1_i4.p1 TRINITY_DN9609_c0_g1~~TRINITY_DN9609_c0_g1_i4.p1  ORF type:complete len:180 (-),score=27.38 TRINITY_DN9609_c0_g1_i4:852-1391(-)